MNDPATPSMTREESWLLRDKYHGVRNEDFEKDRTRLRDGEPLAYVIGFVPFLDTVIHLDSRPLIPRPETEYWVGEIAARHASAARILDLCAGSGCIGVAALKRLPSATVDFVEIEPVHHATIAKNLKENGIAGDRARILGGDLFQYAEGPYDLILSNPPYIGSDEMDLVEESVREHEPARALFAGTDGLALIERIVEEAPAYLAHGSPLYIEHAKDQGPKIQAMAAARGYRQAITENDQYGHPRVTHLTS